MPRELYEAADRNRVMDFEVRVEAQEAEGWPERDHPAWATAAAMLGHETKPWPPARPGPGISVELEARDAPAHRIAAGAADTFGKIPFVAGPDAAWTVGAADLARRREALLLNLLSLRGCAGLALGRLADRSSELGDCCSRLHSSVLFGSSDDGYNKRKRYHKSDENERENAPIHGTS